jgi:hypothetical protein
VVAEELLLKMDRVVTEVIQFFQLSHQVVVAEAEALVLVEDKVALVAEVATMVKQVLLVMYLQ